MPDLHFHPVYAWNLIDDLYDGGALGELTNFARSELGRGRAEGWISPENKHRARMFAVYADSVVLPGLVDGVDYEALRSDGHFKNRSDLVDLGVRRSLRSRPEGLVAITDKLLETHGETVVDADDVEALLGWLQALREFEEEVAGRFQPGVWELVDGVGMREAIARGNPGAAPGWERFPEDAKASLVRILRDDPLKHAAEFAPLEKAIEREYLTIADALQLAERCIPTLADRRRARPQRRDSQVDGIESYDAVITLYFENVQFPGPRTAMEAIAMRGNPSVQEWRSQLSRWASALERGQTNIASLKQDIDEANSYIAGARLLSERLAVFSPCICFSAATLALAIEHPVAKVISGTLFTIEGVKAYGELVRKAAESPSRLQHKWLMLSSN